MESQLLKELKESLWNQFSAGIDMLMNAIKACPEKLYTENRRFFYIAYHSAVFLDYYLTMPPKNFKSKLPFTITPEDEIPEDAIDDVVPNENYTKKQLLEYIRSSKAKCHKVIRGIKEKENPRFKEDIEVGKIDYSLIEILIYNLRHVQHHTGQLNMILRSNGIEVPKWILGSSDGI